MASVPTPGEEKGLSGCGVSPEFRYHIPAGVTACQATGRPALSTPQRGSIIVDKAIIDLWGYANGRTLTEIEVHFADSIRSTEVIRAALACLAEAGLLRRDISHTEGVWSHVSGPLVTVIVVGCNSRDWLAECLPSLVSQTYSPIDILVVDNASTDSTSNWLSLEYPQVKLLRNEVVQPLACAINKGIAATQGDYFLILNPDVRLEPDTVAQLMAVALQHERAIVVGKLKLLWAPAFLNGLGNSVGAFHWGTDTALGHLDLGQFDDWREVPSACFAAALISRSVWEFVGPMDEGFPMYYEDSEWSYRARLLGLRIYLASKAVVYHALSGKMSPRGETNLSPRKLHFVAYGRLRFAVKILGTSLIKFLFNYFLEDFLGILLAVIRLNRPVLAAYLGAWGDFWSDLPDLRAARRVIQSHREISDAELFRLQKQLPAPLVWHGLPELTWDIINNHYLPILLSGKTRLMPEFEGSCPRLLIVSNDIIAERMAGPGIRYLEMARALHENLHVTLAVPSEVTLTVPGVQLAHYSTENPTDLREMAVSSDVILVSSFIIEKFPFLEQAARRLVVDLYDPFVLENLHYYTNEPMSIQESLNEHGVTITNHLARIGDFFICANERQRDYWMGVLTANGRVNPHTFVQDKSLRNLIDVVGIGIPDREPQVRPLVRGIHPQVPSNARIVLWGGGIWDWLDPLTLVKAWPRVLQSHPEARLIFLGTRHPNPLVPRHALAEQTERLATEVGEKDHTILFFEWLSYEDREALLAEADIGVLLHPIHIETRYSIRTRVLDYLWARLPVLITDGDVTSEWVRLYGIGRVVPPFDEAAGAEALCNLLETPKEAYAAAFGPLREQYRWRRVVEPLKRYCLGGQPAPDRGRQIADLVPNSKLPAWRWLLGRAWYILRQDGLGALLHRVWRYVQWRLSRP